MRKISLAAALLALVMIFTGCSSLIEVNRDRDMARTVIKVEGQEVTKEEYANNYYSVMYYNGITVSDLSDSKTASDLQETAIDVTVNNQILKIKAKEYGCYDFTQEELDDIQAQYDDLVGRYKLNSQTKIEDDQANADLSREELDKLIEEDLATTLEELGFEEEEYIQGLKDQEALGKLRDIMTETDDPTESEMQSVYNQKVEEQKKAFTEGTSDYANTVSRGRTTIYYYLSDTRKTKHILIGLPEDIQSQITQLRQNGDDEAADSLRDEELEKIKDEADEVYALAEGGADFDGLIADYGDDPGMESGDPYVVANGNSAFVPEFTEGLFSLKNPGDFTQPVASDFGYHIILYLEDVPEGAAPIDQVKDEIKAEMISAEQEELYAAQLEEWRDQMKIRVYKSRLKLDLK